MIIVAWKIATLQMTHPFIVQTGKATLATRFVYTSSNVNSHVKIITYT